MNRDCRKLYWHGNAAKTRIIEEILSSHASQGSENIVVFDFGCGDGGDWPTILRENLQIKLIGFEPSNVACRIAKKRLQDCDAEIFGGNDINRLSILANYIVSFSVFEHVVDKVAYLKDAKRLLAPDGVFYLNYDDGHFRNELDLSDIGSWSPALRAKVRTIVSPAMAALGRQEKYQQRVIASEIDQLVKDAGFKINRIDYDNLASLKALAKTMPVDLRENFSRWWLCVERDLNERFRCVLQDVSMGDAVNLWREMGSRTLRLHHL